MRMRGEVLLFLRILRVAVSSPANLITCAMVAAIFIMIATAPKPSMLYIGDKLFELLAVASLLFVPLFGLYLLIRLSIAIFGKWQRPISFGWALWALLTPIVIGVLAETRYEMTMQSTRLSSSYTRK